MNGENKKSLKYLYSVFNTTTISNLLKLSISLTYIKLILKNEMILFAENITAMPIETQVSYIMT